MRFFILAMVAIVVFADAAVAQHENPFADVLLKSTKFEVVDTDDEQTVLLKQSFNAAHREMRLRYNYWRQGVGEIDGLLGSIDRLHKLRLEVGPAGSEVAFVEQKIAFAMEIESHCKKENSKAKYEAIRDIDEASALAYRIRAELELAKLRGVAGSLPPD